MSIGRHWQYGKYLLRHKWFVFVAGCRLGIPFLAALHDNSKFRPDEWGPYAAFFYEPDGTKRTRRDSTGYYKPTDTGNAAFDFAWLLHQKRNKHHWQWWFCPKTRAAPKCWRCRIATAVRCWQIGAAPALLRAHPTRFGGTRSTVTR